MGFSAFGFGTFARDFLEFSSGLVPEKIHYTATAFSSFADLNNRQVVIPCCDCKKSLAIAIDFCNLVPFLGQNSPDRGEVPSHLRVVPPGQRSGAIYCLVQVFAMCASMFWIIVCFDFLWCLLCYLQSYSGHFRTAKCWDNTFGVFVLCKVGCPLFAPPGAVPVVGGYLYPSVLRSPGVTPQKCRAAHGPLHPAVTSPPRLCWFGIWYFVRFSGLVVGYFVWFF